MHAADSVREHIANAEQRAGECYPDDARLREVYLCAALRVILEDAIDTIDRLEGLL